MKKGKGLLPLILGAALVVLSLCLVLVFQLQMTAAGEKCQSVVAQLEQLLPEKISATAELCPDTPMPALQIGGEDYAALLEIPAFGLQLPVADNWQGGDLAAAPSRFCGSAYTDTLVIGGKDHPGQFDFCGKIELGTQVTITDMTGQRFTYTVTRVDRSQNAANDWLVQDKYDLTLFCRDMYSLEYIAVRCNAK